MGAPEWFIDTPAGWNAQQKKDVIRAVKTYKTRIRPLVRAADLYHIFPRPDGRSWDGIEYYDPATRKGVVYLFKPGDGEGKTTVRLRGLDAKRKYRVSFQDGSNPTVVRSGATLARGIEVTLKGKLASELMFFEAAADRAAPRETRGERR